MTKKRTLIILIAILFAGLLVFAWNNKNIPNQNKENLQGPTQPGMNEDSTINLDPPTESEQQVGDQIKKEIADKEDQSANTTELLDEADVIIVDASQYGQEVEVRAFAANVVEDGTCTVTFTQGDSSFSKEVPAYADASTTPCIALTVTRSEFTSDGTWVVDVTYSSPSAQGNVVGSLEVK